MSRAGTVDVDHGSLWYELAGEGSAVVFLHPGLWDSRAWDGQFDSFARRYRAVRYDLRGYGKSSRPKPGERYSHVRDLVALLDALAIDRAALIGCSMGGGVGLDLALARPERVTALVLVASAPSGMDETSDDEAWWTLRAGPIEDAISGGDLERARRLQMEIWAPLGIGDTNGRRIFEIAMDNAHELTMDESGVEPLSPPAAHRLGEVNVPTLILPADHDPPFMARATAALATEIPTARLVHLANVDHVVAMRAPEAFNDVVLTFLDEVL